jgi:hypothetical protein
MIRRRRTLLLGLALVALLAGGIGAALLWPMSSEAEQMAALIHEGMTQQQVEKIVGPHEGRAWFSEGWGCVPDGREWRFQDGSALQIGFCPNITSINVAPPDPPLPRLRRTLARAFPFLGE